MGVQLKLEVGPWRISRGEADCLGIGLFGGFAFCGGHGSYSRNRIVAERELGFRALCLVVYVSG